MTQVQEHSRRQRRTEEERGQGPERDAAEGRMRGDRKRETMEEKVLRKNHGNDRLLNEDNYITFGPLRVLICSGRTERGKKGGVNSLHKIKPLKRSPVLLLES